MAKPSEVTAPFDHVRGVIYDDGDFAMVVGEEKDASLTLGERWNGGTTIGFPQSRGVPCWNRVPYRLSRARLLSLLADPRTDKFVNRPVVMQYLEAFSA
jgi:hypothetical protein